MVIRRIALSTIILSIMAGTFAVLPASAMTPDAYSHYQKGVQLEKSQDFRGAEREYRLAIGLDPYDSLTYLKLAYLVERDNRYGEALEFYKNAFQLNPKDTMIHLSIAQVYEAENQSDKALGEYKALVASNPDYPYAYLPMARLEKTLKDSPQAIADYQIFLKSYPKHYDAQRELAALLLVNKNYSQAAETYKNLKALDASKFKDNLAYGVALNNADQSEKALSVFKTIKTPTPLLYEEEGMAYEKLNRLPDAYHAYQNAIALSPDEKNGLYLKMADIASSLNEPDKAIDALKAYLKYHPDNAQITKSLGNLYLQKKSYDLAESTYQDALKQPKSMDPSSEGAVLRNLGYADQMQGKLEDAIQAYQKSLAIQDNYQTRLNLALAYHKQGHYEKALVLYRKLLTQTPQSPLLKKDMGQVLLALGDQAFKNKDYQTAMNHYQDAFLLDNEKNTPALLGMANAQYALQNYDVAYTTYQSVLEKDPANFVARLNKAQLDIKQRNYIQATENLRWIVKNNPDFVDAYKMLAQVYESLGDYGNAIVNYKKALELQPTDSAMLIGYGNAWRQIGDLERAQHAYEMAQTQSPDNALIHYNLGSLYNLKDQLDLSLKEYKEAIQDDPQFLETYYGMGTTLEKQKKLKQAMQVYQQYVEKAPPSGSYVSLAKQRIEIIQKLLNAQKPKHDSVSSEKS